MINSKNTKRKQVKRRNLQRSLLSDGPAYRQQQKWIATIPEAALLYSTTITTGVISQVYTVGTGGVTGFAARFGSTFDEFRVLSARFIIRCVNVSSGVTKFWFDEKSSSAPTSNESLERNLVTLDNNSASPRSSTTMVWKARDLLDLEYTAIGSTTTPVYFKIYTDTATWAAPITVTPLWSVYPELSIEFRGLKST